MTSKRLFEKKEATEAARDPTGRKNPEYKKITKPMFGNKMSPWPVDKRNARGEGYPSVKYRNKSIPEAPGIYVFYDVHDRVIYIGKSTNLRTRIACHISTNPDKNSKVPTIEIVQVDFTVVPEAHLRNYLELKYLHEQNPPYNQTQVQS